MSHYTMCPDDPEIRWWAISNCDGMYEVSDTGLVRRAVRTRTYPKHSLLAQTRSDDGYCTVSLRIKDEYKRTLVHRIVMITFSGDCPPGYEVNHIDGKKANNRLSNLEYMTRSQNLKH